MKALFISMIIGLVAGFLDILPMIRQKQSKRSIFSAFLQYFFVSIIIVNINLPGIAWWLQGGLIALAISLPIIIIVSEKETKAAPIIAVTAVILGTLIGIAGYLLK